MVTHVDAGLMTVPYHPAVKCVGKFTILREPTSRLKSAITYAGATSLDYIQKNRHYAGDNHMVRMIAGQIH